MARWYVRHAEQYIKAYPNQRLGSHTPREIEQYLRGKGRNPRLDDRFCQIVDALKILFVEMVQPLRQGQVLPLASAGFSG